MCWRVVMVEVALCPNCHKSIPADAVLCPYCGTKFEKSDKALCPKCGKEVPADANLCPYCGAKFGGMEPGRFIPAPAAEHPTIPKPYTKHILELEYGKGKNISFYGFIGFIFILVGAISYLAMMIMSASGGGGGSMENLPGELAALMYFSIYLGVLKLLMMVMALIFAGYVALQSKKHLQAVVSCVFVVSLEALSTFYAFITIVLYTLYLLASGGSDTGGGGGGGGADLGIILAFTAIYLTMYIFGALIILHDYELQKEEA
jgi:RNA polymerase subunit RPABC4/transcription elongation factor Spt4